MEPNREKRERLVWDIERRLAEEWRPAGHLLPSRRDVPAALGERADDHGEYHLQWLALRRRLARQVEVLRPCHRLCWHSNEPRGTRWAAPNQRGI
jgi:hypothetical protein